MCTSLLRRMGTIILNFKKFTSVAVAREILAHGRESRRLWILEMLRQRAAQSYQHEKFRLWQEGYHPKECFNAAVLAQKLNYLHWNGIR